ncbi:hypothetical protein KL935_001158 [Ogataea polymorpha]|nr:hypothetical protein KL937_000572 [Ogataea polymorpha]KAG7902250.1 hypothetical protein KL935_001158 [Ogataea polymorpha]KAG7911762.1 hypothetical protein KL906_001083 [Ogataea polymorpha]KAG7912402.1 hypothetical protein KL907_000604 [Ogataea polymorpha]KAG7939631.1 hypothetical protein KL904_000569 [Ogataea polymorpha]
MAENNKKEPKPGGRGFRRSSKKQKDGQDSRVSPQLLEINKLIKKFKPITVNGIPVSSLSKPLDEFLTIATADKSNDLYLSFLLKPSDPDFPYDLDFLNLSLCIPGTYPYKGKPPSLVVLNDDIPRGYSVNVEIGFREIATLAMERRRKRPVESELQLVSGNDLLSMVSTLDKYLERFLSMEKKDTIKFVKTVRKEPKPQKQERTEKEKPAENSLRAAEIDRFLARLQSLQINLFKETNQNSIYKFELPFEDDAFTIAIDNLQDIVIQRLAVKLSIPKDYPVNQKRGIKLEIDLSNSSNMQLINSIEDKNLKLIFGKLISNMNANFSHASVEMVKAKNTSITSQINMFVQNIEKFLRPPADFARWLGANETLNQELRAA